MAHNHAHGHSHSHGQRGRALFVSLILTAGFVVAEAVAGLRAGSLALLSDAGHNFTDAFGLLLAAIAFVVQSRPANHVKTYGYHRTGVLAAFINALLLVALSLALFYESYGRVLHPQPVAENIMIWVAGAGLILNLAIAWGLSRSSSGTTEPVAAGSPQVSGFDEGRSGPVPLRGHGDDINVRAVWIHMLGDAGSCVGIIVGAVVIHYTGWLAVDPLLSILIGAAIIWTAWDIFRDSLNILLEGLPKGLKLAEVARQVRTVEGVIDVHDLHIWSLGSEAHALSCHVLIEDMPPSASDSILRCVNRVLADRFEIHHTTVQFEHARCALAEEPCTAAKHQH